MYTNCNCMVFDLHAEAKKAPVVSSFRATPVGGAMLIEFTVALLAHLFFVVKAESSNRTRLWMWPVIDRPVLLNVAVIYCQRSAYGQSPSVSCVNIETPLRVGRVDILYKLSIAYSKLHGISCRIMTEALSGCIVFTRIDLHKHGKQMSKF